MPDSTTTPLSAEEKLITRLTRTLRKKETSAIVHNFVTDQLVQFVADLRAEVDAAEN